MATFSVCFLGFKTFFFNCFQKKKKLTKAEKNAKRMKKKLKKKVAKNIHAEKAEIDEEKTSKIPSEYPIPKPVLAKLEKEGKQWLVLVVLQATDGKTKQKPLKTATKCCLFS